MLMVGLQARIEQAHLSPTCLAEQLFAWLKASEFDASGWSWARDDPGAPRARGIVRQHRVEHLLWGDAHPVHALRADLDDSDTEFRGGSWIPDEIYARFRRLLDRREDATPASLLSASIDEMWERIHGRGARWVELWLDGLSVDRAIEIDGSVELTPDEDDSSRPYGMPEPDSVLRLRRMGEQSEQDAQKSLMVLVHLLRIITMSPVSASRRLEYVEGIGSRYQGRDYDEGVALPDPGSSWIGRCDLTRAHLAELHTYRLAWSHGCSEYAGVIDCLERALFTLDQATTLSWVTAAFEALLAPDAHTGPAGRDLVVRRVPTLLEISFPRDQFWIGAFGKSYGRVRNATFHGKPSEVTKIELTSLAKDNGRSPSEFVGQMLDFLRGSILATLSLAEAHRLNLSQVPAWLDKNRKKATS